MPRVLSNVFIHNSNTKLKQEQFNKHISSVVIVVVAVIIIIVVVIIIVIIIIITIIIIIIIIFIIIIKSPQYTGGDFMFLYRFVRRCRRRP